MAAFARVFYGASWTDGLIGILTTAAVLVAVAAVAWQSNGGGAK